MRAGNNFDGVRLAAALAVFASHQLWIGALSEPTTFGALTLGGLAVFVFFSISGYLVAASWHADPKIWRFAARRFLRIWPAYIVVVVCASLWVGMTDPRPLAVTAAWMFVYKHFFFQQFDWAFFPSRHDPRLNPSIWTIPFEVSCYVAFAFLAGVYGVVASRSTRFRQERALVLAGCGAAAFVWWGYGMAAFDPSTVSMTTDATMFGTFFAAGTLLFHFPGLRTLKASGALVLFGVLVYWAGSQVIGMAIFVPTTAVFIGSSNWPMLSKAGRFGDLSYGIYLWGWPVQQIVSTHMDTEVGIWRLSLVSLGLTTLIAAMSWHIVEKWALRAKPSSNAAWPRSLMLEWK